MALGLEEDCDPLELAEEALSFSEVEPLFFSEEEEADFCFSASALLSDVVLSASLLLVEEAEDSLLSDWEESDVFAEFSEEESIE